MSADTNRRLENLIRLGKIKSIQPGQPFTTVTVNLGDITTANIRYLNLRAGKDRTWDPPSIDEEVIVLSPGGELTLGVAISGLNNLLYPAPSDELNKKIRLFEDGCLISYDIQTHDLQAILPAGGTATITAPGGLTINADTTINGDVTISGTTHSAKSISTDQNISAAGSMASTGNISTEGTVAAVEDVTAGEISLGGHKHGGVKAGTDDSGDPK